MTSSLHATKWCRASSCFLLISEIRVSRNKAHAAPRVSFYGLFVVETKLITPRGSAPYRRVRIIHPLCAREGAAFFIKSHISRARRRPINLPWRFLLWRRAKPWERKREGGGKRKREWKRERRELSIFHVDEDASLHDGTLSIFTFVPRVTDVTRVRRRRNRLKLHLNVECLKIR